jgi:hypothetical protein
VAAVRSRTVTLQAPSRPRPLHEAEAVGEKVARSRGFDWLARAGFAARGVIYVLIGILALDLALGHHRQQASQQGALRTIADQPLGEVLLIAVAIGLAGYALWRFVHALVGHGKERSSSGLDRVAAFASGVVYAGFCAVAIEILLGSGSGGSENTQQTAAGVFRWPAGTWLVGIAGAVFVGVGLYQGYRGVTKDFLEETKPGQMGAGLRRWIVWIGTFGHLARMVVFCLVGAFLIKAAVEYDPSNAVGLDGALAKLEHASYGPYLLGVVAAGLAAFGVYSLSNARYGRV